jgi:hypothetical protein
MEAEMEESRDVRRVEEGREGRTCVCVYIHY